MLEKLVWATTDVTQYRATDVEGVGRLRSVENKTFRWVKNSTGVAMVAGRLYYHGTGNTLGYVAEVFTFGQSTKGTAINTMAGIAAAAIPIGQYGWVQCYGVYSGAGVEGTTDVAATDLLKGVSGQTYMVLNGAAGATNLANIGGKIIALAAQAADAVAATDVFINCL